MNNPTNAARYTQQSAPLTDGEQYGFVVRIATAPWPSGIKTQNTVEHAATCDATQPLPPAISASLV